MKMALAAVARVMAMATRVWGDQQQEQWRRQQLWWR
jgi:hypothetical protein